MLMPSGIINMVLDILSRYFKILSQLGSLAPPLEPDSYCSLGGHTCLPPDCIAFCPLPPSPSPLLLFPFLRPFPYPPLCLGTNQVAVQRFMCPSTTCVRITPIIHSVFLSLLHVGRVVLISFLIFGCNTNMCYT